MAVDIGTYGRTNDSKVFKNFAVDKHLYCGNFGIPLPRPLPGSDGPPLPFVLVADEAFQMSVNLVKPYFSHGLNLRKTKIFS